MILSYSNDKISILHLNNVFDKNLSTYTESINNKHKDEKVMS